MEYSLYFFPQRTSKDSSVENVVDNIFCYISVAAPQMSKRSELGCNGRGQAHARYVRM